jgi:hypothetical protein
MIQTFDDDRFHLPPPLKHFELSQRSAEDKGVFLFVHLLNVGYRSSENELEIQDWCS